MKILVLSDSHGYLTRIEQAIRAEQPDRIVFLGDCVSDFLAVCDTEFYRKQYETVPVHIVSGNCDTGSGCSFPEKSVLEIGGKRFYLTHGHRENVKAGYLRLCFSAMESGAEVVLFGHTHLKCQNQYNGLELLNPGAAMHGSYGIIFLRDGELRTEVKRLS